jgi:hypothetical protein
MGKPFDRVALLFRVVKELNTTGTTATKVKELKVKPLFSFVYFVFEKLHPIKNGRTDMCNSEEEAG